jgi:hypothetical protein
LIGNCRQLRGSAECGSGHVILFSKEHALSDESQITKAADPTSDAKRYRLVQMADIEPVPCPCGQAKRAFMDEPDRSASMHITEIHHDSKTHYHKTMTEM